MRQFAKLLTGLTPSRGSNPLPSAKVRYLMYSHYCFEGIVHSDRCKCNCPSCSTYEATIIRNEFNKRLSRRIKETREDLFMLIIKDDNAREALIKELKGKYSSVKTPCTPPKKGILSRLLSRIRDNN